MRVPGTTAAAGFSAAFAAGAGSAAGAGPAPFAGGAAAGGRRNGCGLNRSDMLDAVDAHAFWHRHLTRRGR